MKDVDNNDDSRDVLAALMGAILASATNDGPGDPAETSDSPQGEGAQAVAQPKRRARPSKKRKVTELPKWNVVLLDDDDHTYEYVIEMLGRLFAHSIRTSIRMAREVDTGGRVIVFTTHKELAELKCAQIRRFGIDPRINTCTGSMRAVIEPAT